MGHRSYVKEVHHGPQVHGAAERYPPRTFARAVSDRTPYSESHVGRIPLLDDTLTAFQLVQPAPHHLHLTHLLLHYKLSEHYQLSVLVEWDHAPVLPCYEVDCARHAKVERRGSSCKIQEKHRERHMHELPKEDVCWQTYMFDHVPQPLWSRYRTPAVCPGDIPLIDCRVPPSHGGRYTFCGGKLWRLLLWVDLSCRSQV